MALAIRAVVEDRLPYRAASWRLWRDHRVFVPFAIIQNWVEAGGKRASLRLESDYLDCALADFSGHLAADELYDGPFCVFSSAFGRAAAGGQRHDHGWLEPLDSLNLLRINSVITSVIP
jgi:hypothetical protein